MGDQFNELKEFVGHSDVRDRVEILFVDLFEDDLKEYDYAKKILDMGYKIPLTFINEKPAYAGDINIENIIKAIRNSHKK